MMFEYNYNYIIWQYITYLYIFMYSILEMKWQMGEMSPSIFCTIFSIENVYCQAALSRTSVALAAPGPVYSWKVEKQHMIVGQHTGTVPNSPTKTYVDSWWLFSQSWPDNVTREIIACWGRGKSLLRSLSSCGFSSASGFCASAWLRPASK